jgi:hypothetical protein
MRRIVGGKIKMAAEVVYVFSDNTSTVLSNTLAKCQKVNWQTSSKTQ